MINFEPNSQREDPTSPYELFRGQKIDYKRLLRILFGDYAECTDPHVTLNTMERRTDPCIALLPLLNVQGSNLFYNLKTRRLICIRDKWTELPFPEDILKRVNKLAARQRKKLRVQPNFAYESVDEDNNFFEHIDDNNLYDDDPADTSTDSRRDSDEEDDDANDNLQMRENLAEEIEENERIRQEIQAENTLRKSIQIRSTNINLKT